MRRSGRPYFCAAWKAASSDSYWPDFFNCSVAASPLTAESVAEVWPTGASGAGGCSTGRGLTASVTGESAPHRRANHAPPMTSTHATPIQPSERARLPCEERLGFLMRGETNPAAPAFTCHFHPPRLTVPIPPCPASRHGGGVERTPRHVPVENDGRFGPLAMA